MRAESLKGHLDLLLLTVLRLHPAHGYAIVQSLRERSRGTFDLPEGTIYPALHRLERAGFLRSEWSSDSGRRRRVYRVTHQGARALAARRQEWRDLAQGVEAVLGT